MSDKAFALVMGARGLIGSALFEFLEGVDQGPVIGLTRDNYDSFKGTAARFFFNANGNSRRFWAEQHPEEDFEASVASVGRTLFDFKFDSYVYISTVDVYTDPSPEESTVETLDGLKPPTVYGAHKLLAEKMVQRFTTRSYVLRLGTVVGKNLKKNPVFDMMRGNPLFVTMDTQYNFVHTDFVAQVAFMIVKNKLPFGVYNVAGKSGLTMEKAARLLNVQNVSVSPEARRWVYNVNTEKLGKFITIPSSELALKNLSEKDNP